MWSQEDPSERYLEGFKADTKNIFTWKTRIDTKGPNENSGPQSSVVSEAWAW